MMGRELQGAKAPSRNGPDTSQCAVTEIQSHDELFVVQWQDIALHSETSSLPNIVEHRLVLRPLGHPQPPSVLRVRVDPKTLGL